MPWCVGGASCRKLDEERHQGMRSIAGAVYSAHDEAVGGDAAGVLIQAR